MGILFCYQNLLASAVISASSEVASLPDDNIVHFWKSKVWRATGCASEWVKFNLGAAKAFKAIMLTGHNLTSGATVHFQANATDVWTAPPVDVTATWHAGYLLYVWAASQTYQWIRITIVDPGNPDGYVEAGLAWADPAVAPERNYSTYEKQPVDPTVITEADSGPESFEDKEPYNLLSFEFKNVLTDEIEALRKAVGLKNYFFIIPDYDNALETDGRHELTAYGRLAELPQYSHRYLKRKDVSLGFREAL